MSELLLIVRTALRRYAVSRGDVTDVRFVAGPEDLRADASGRPYVGVELGALLDPQDQSSLPRRQALVVPLRRRSVALLVDRVEEVLEGQAPLPLPALLRERLREPWATGALLAGDEIVVRLDLRAVARTALTAAPGAAEPTTSARPAN